MHHLEEVHSLEAKSTKQPKPKTKPDVPRYGTQNRNLLCACCMYRILIHPRIFAPPAGQILFAMNLFRFENLNFRLGMVN